MELQATIESGASKAKSQAKGDVSDFQKLKYFTDYKPASRKLDESSKKSKASVKKLADDLKATKAAVAKIVPKAVGANKELNQKMRNESDKGKKRYLMGLAAETSTQLHLLSLHGRKLDDALSQCQKINSML
jgi:hypothetical protein